MYGINIKGDRYSTRKKISIFLPSLCLNVAHDVVLKEGMKTNKIKNNSVVRVNAVFIYSDNSNNFQYPVKMMLERDIPSKHAVVHSTHLSVEL